MKNKTIVVQGTEITIATRHEQDYISLTDMVKHFDGGSALIEQWLKNKDTVLFLGVWEQLNNPDFVSNSLEFEGIRNEAGRNSEGVKICLLSSKRRVSQGEIRKKIGVGTKFIRIFCEFQCRITRVSQLVNRF